MKILYFFEILEEGNFIDYYIRFKKREIRNNITYIRHLYSESKISKFCLNKGESYLSSKKFDENISSVSNEYFNIKKEVYNTVINTVWSNVRNLYRNLTKSKLKVLNNIWSFIEYRITSNFMKEFEKFEFIKSIIQRENPKIIYFCQKNTFFFEYLKQELELNNINFFFLKSQIDYLYHNIKYYSTKIYDFFFKFKNDVKYALQFKYRKKKKKQPKPVDICHIGINAPGNYYYSKELSCLVSQLKVDKIKFNVLRHNYEPAPLFRNLKFKYALPRYIKSNLKHLFVNERNKNEIIRYIRPSLKEYAFYMLKDIFFYEIRPIIYIIRGIREEFESSNYKVIIILNEFDSPGKIINYLGKEYGIKICFIPYCGIPRRESDVTPYLSDIICVDGKLDKEYLTKKGVNSEKILVRGSPKYESIMKKNVFPLNQIEDHFTGKIHPISSNKRKVLLATNIFTNESNWITLNTVLNVIKKFKDIEFIIKLHPQQDGKFIRKILRQLDFEAIIVKNIDIFEILKTVDIFLTEESSVILDSMVVGTPIICLDFTNQSIYFSAKHVYNDEKYIIKVKNEQQLFQRLKELLDSQEKIEDYKNSLKANLKLILYHEKNYSPTQQIISDLRKFLN